MQKGPLIHENQVHLSQTYAKIRLFLILFRLIYLRKIIQFFFSPKLCFGDAVKYKSTIKIF